ncbi:unnamed protein product [Scytosiphon promiscuus]
MRRRDNSDPNRNPASSRSTCVIVCFHSSLVALSTQQTPSAVLHSGAPPRGARRAVHGDRPRAGSRTALTKHASGSSSRNDKAFTDSIWDQLFVFMTNSRRTAHGLVNLHLTVFDRVKMVKYMAPYYDASGTLLGEIRSHLRLPSYAPCLDIWFVDMGMLGRSNVPRRTESQT